MRRKCHFGIQQLGWYNGRMIRDGQGHPGGGTPTGDGNNSGGTGDGNGGDSASGGGDSNNTGGNFDAAAFWNGPAQGDDAAPSGESASGNGSESGTPSGDQRSEFATQLQGRLDALTFGDPIFNEAIAGEINEGNYAGVQERFNDFGRAAVRESLSMVVSILRPFSEQLLEQVRGEVGQTFTRRDNTESLHTLFPAAKNPAMAKTIQPIYDQALKNNKGDREAAVAQTKEMLRYMAGESAEDLNLDIAPRGEGDRRPVNRNFNWLDELTGRK